MEARILTNSSMEGPEFIAVARGSAAVFSARSPDPDHPANEDSAAIFQIDDDRAVLALADGVGGASSGDVASRIALRQLQLSIERGLDEGRPLRGCILDAFENANLAIAERRVGAATTLAVGCPARHKAVILTASTPIELGRKDPRKRRQGLRKTVALQNGFLDPCQYFF